MVMLLDQSRGTEVKKISCAVSLPHIPGTGVGCGDGRGLTGSTRRPNSDGRRKEKKRATSKVLSYVIE